MKKANGLCKNSPSGNKIKKPHKPWRNVHHNDNVPLWVRLLFSLWGPLFFVLFGTLKYKNGQKRAFLVFSSLKNGCSACSHFWAVSMVFLPDFTGSYAMQYNRAQILLPEPQKISRSSRKNFPRIQQKFPGVPWKVLACVTRSFRLSF